MDFVSKLPIHESPILTALFQSDASAWCYVPIDKSEKTLCSIAFASLWNLPPLSNKYENPHPRSLGEIATALTSAGIDAGEFLSLVANHHEKNQTPVFLVPHGASRLQAEIRSVTSSNAIIGHLVRFQKVIEPAVLDLLMKEISEAERRLQVLSHREREILHLVYEGRTNKSISISSEISEKTVEKHRAKIMQKLNLGCSAHLFRLVSKAWLFSDIIPPVTNPPHAGRDRPQKSSDLQPPIACDET